MTCTLGIDIGTFETKGVLVDDAIDATVTGCFGGHASCGIAPAVSHRG